MEYEVDVEIICDNDDCQYYPREFETVQGTDGEIHNWTCPGCKTKYTFEIEFEPTVTNIKQVQNY
ncbi:hypothetical protein CTM97_15760 [Photobacterium phosphoreum]|uniref:Uncharacterized protein n=1 Tax=Photobacterium phosphoreum TaxID=659 RepID=A0A2T3JT78_PHOPO|nr:hypothetical protein [Photobacterium phosphoreum]PSU22026.1 hypothetical protein CTM96_16915 [Photobacterium phosphoreum]PSU40462.1 hypothetical protein CTM97_15760 [Photobacterium phosphoreum]PSU52329.1 hypothetical protein C9J18_09290 [Photobacterium phosphoreum]